jgi:hypothetical protein
VEADGCSLSYIPDHEPGLGAPLTELEEEWISGFDLARDAGLLLHDCQYTDDEYEDHVGWGHSRQSDALTFAQRTGADQVLLFHHDPLHSDDFLDAMAARALTAWEGMGRRPDRLDFASERREIELRGRAAVSGRGAQ